MGCPGNPLQKPSLYFVPGVLGQLPMWAQKTGYERLCEKGNGVGECLQQAPKFVLLVFIPSQPAELQASPGLLTYSSASGSQPCLLPIVSEPF